MAHPDRSVRTVSAPPESLVSQLYLGSDLLDAYATGLKPGDPRDVRLLATRLLTTSPGWLKLLLRIRDALVASLGIKTSSSMLRSAAGRPDHISFMRVYQTTANEVVLGEDDRHLDFRLSVLIRPRAADIAGEEVVATTVVHCHNLTGRIYLWLITPFHRVVARSMLRRLHHATAH